MSEAEERISELEDKMVEITSEEQNKVKGMKRTENSLKILKSLRIELRNIDLWNNIDTSTFE